VHHYLSAFRRYAARGDGLTPPARRLLAALAAVLLTASCSTPGAGTPGPSMVAPSAVPSTPPSTAPPPSAPPAALTAANGVNANACRDGTCEIIVKGTSEFALTGKFSGDGIVISFTKPNKVVLVVSVRDGEDLTATITGTGYLALAFGLTITVEKTTPGGALVRVNPAKNDPRNHKGSGTEGFSLYSTSG
jgi:hypothetical protein